MKTISNFKIVKLCVTFSLGLCLTMACQAPPSDKQIQADEAENQLNKTELKTYMDMTFITIDKDGDPRTIFTFFVNLYSIEIANRKGIGELINPSDYENYDIPKDAVEACGIEWQGYEEYYYIQSNDSLVTLYKGWQDEDQTTEDYHWILQNTIYLE